MIPFQSKSKALVHPYLIVCVRAERTPDGNSRNRSGLQYSRRLSEVVGIIDGENVKVKAGVSYEREARRSLVWPIYDTLSVRRIVAIQSV